MMILQCAILFGCLALGELIIHFTHIQLPSSILGMLILTLFLKLKVVKLEWIKGLSDFLVANIGFFFVPPGVAIMLYFDVIRAELWPIVIATSVSTVLVLAFTGWSHEIAGKVGHKVSDTIQHHHPHLPHPHLHKQGEVSESQSVLSKDKEKK